MLPIGSSTQVLTVTGGVPVWATASGSGSSGTYTPTFTAVTNVATFPIANSSIFIAAGSSGPITSYGVVPSDGTTYTKGEWDITTPANLNVDYGKTITVRTPTVTSITPVIVTTAMINTLFTPSGIEITPLA